MNPVLECCLGSNKKKKAKLTKKGIIKLKKPSLKQINVQQAINKTKVTSEINLIILNKKLIKVELFIVFCYIIYIIFNL